MEGDADAPHPLTQLPVALLRAVFAQLPSDARACCAGVCRAWRDAAAAPELWTVVDLTRSGGATVARVNPTRVLPALAPRLAHTRVLKLQLCGKATQTQTTTGRRRS